MLVIRRGHEQMYINALVAILFLYRSISRQYDPTTRLIFIGDGYETRIKNGTKTPGRFSFFFFFSSFFSLSLSLSLRPLVNTDLSRGECFRVVGAGRHPLLVSTFIGNVWSPAAARRDSGSIVRPREQLGRFNYPNLIFAICTIRKCRIITENPIGRSTPATKA